MTQTQDNWCACAKFCQFPCHLLQLKSSPNQRTLSAPAHLKCSEKEGKYFTRKYSIINDNFSYKTVNIGGEVNMNSTCSGPFTRAILLGITVAIFTFSTK